MTDDPIPFSPESVTETEPAQRSRVIRWLRVLGTLLLLFILALTLLLWRINELNRAPETFPVLAPVTIESGMEVRAITELLAEEQIVRSSALLYYLIAFLHDPTDIKASTYVFEEPLTARQVAERLTEGDFDTDLVRFVHFEGERASLLAARAEEELPNFDGDAFFAAAEPHEGKLYPDTYFIPLSFTAEELLELLLETYEERIDPLRPSIAEHPLSEREVITLASIVEREANTPESMKLVAGILQNRLAINMALQADATIEYELETPLGELPPGVLAENLREVDSPYNTYRSPGLPPTPIGNPGLQSITAVLEPTESEYLYYITGEDGKFYYAETYEQHLVNIERHLR